MKRGWRWEKGENVLERKKSFREYSFEIQHDDTSKQRCGRGYIKG